MKYAEYLIEVFPDITGIVLIFPEAVSVLCRPVVLYESFVL